MGCGVESESHQAQRAHIWSDWMQLVMEATALLLPCPGGGNRLGPALLTVPGGCKHLSLVAAP